MASEESSEGLRWRPTALGKFTSINILRTKYDRARSPINDSAVTAAVRTSARR